LLAFTEAFAGEPRIENINRIQRNVSKVADLRRIYLALAIVRWRVGDLKTSRQMVAALEGAPPEHGADLILLTTLKRRLADED